uniref:Uncharacterized protein n=1 Tax=Arundo donax TaxID=35708 RepID=A0A0A8Y7Q8_ARUDO
MPGHRVNYAFIFNCTKSNQCHLYNVQYNDKWSKKWSIHIIRTEQRPHKEIY